MNTTQNKNEPAIGRAKTVWVYPGGQGITTSIIAIETEVSHERLTYSGTVTFDDAVKNHINGTVLTLVNSISGALGVILKSYEISAVNIGAASSIDSGVSLSGFSLDVSVFMALLSAAIKLPIRQDLVFTGHIASSDGDISFVQSIPEKAIAAISDDNIQRFVYPDISCDTSLKSLKPKHYETVEAELRSFRGRIKLIPVRDIYDLITKTVDSEDIVLSSLKTGFYNKKLIDNNSTNCWKIAEYFSSSNEKRVWEALEKLIGNCNIDQSHDLIESFAKYHIKMGKYPRKFGEELHNLVLSLPMSVKKTKKLFPLLEKTKYIKMIQYASPEDYEDVSWLHEALYGKVDHTEKSKETKLDHPSNNASDILKYLSERLNDKNITDDITKPFDEAHATFICGKASVESYDELIDLVTGYVTHVIRHTNSLTGIIDHDRAETEAIHIFKSAYPGKNNFNEAIVNAKNGFNGGMNTIFNAITDYLKKEAVEKHTLKTITTAIDPLDMEIKKAIVSQILLKGEDYLPQEILSQPPERYIDEYIELIMTYIQSQTKLTEILRRT